MKTFGATFAIAAALSLILPALAQAQQPGARDASRVVAGTYNVDKNHTQVVWKVNHLGVTPLYGAFGANGGTLEIDPAKLAAAKVTVTFNISEVATTSAGFTKHLMTADFFDAAKDTVGSFTSTSVVVDGDDAKITGNLTLKGVTKPVVLDAEFFGASFNPNTKKRDIGFTAETKIKRSDFGLGFAAPAVSDEVELKIMGAFTRTE